MDLRKQFANTITEMAREDKDILLLTGDLGYSFLEEFQQKHPKQYINCGCIEQSMIGIAAGAALEGRKPFVYSNAVFLLCRAYEAVRDDIAYNNVDVKLIGTGAADFLGFTHNFRREERPGRLLKGLPNIKYQHPTTEKELREAMILDGPQFIKI